MDSKEILSYWTANRENPQSDERVPVCALRTFKAEIGCGISEEAQQRAAAADSNWMVSGKWGVVQFA